MTRAIASLLMFLTLAAAAPAEQALAIESDQVLITVDAQAGGKQISAVSRALDWNITLLGENHAHLHLRIPIDSFDSGHAAIDALVREAAGWTRHPAIDVEGDLVDGQLTSALGVGGLSRPITIPVEIARTGEQIVAHAKFQIDLRDFGIAVSPLDGSAVVEFVARLHASPRAVFSGGSLHGS